MFQQNLGWKFYLEEWEKDRMVAVCTEVTARNDKGDDANTPW
jgi:hypothetical protein